MDVFDALASRPGPAIRSLGLLLGAVGALTPAVGCGGDETPPPPPPPECAMDSDCRSPLGCVGGVCRAECVSSRDCPAGLDCVRITGSAGSCLLPEEETCVVSDDCPAPLRCRLSRCMNPCEMDDDCVGDALCLPDPAGIRSCVEVACDLDSDCPAPLVCDFGSCASECHDDRDCASDELCLEQRCVTPDPGP